MTKSQKQKRTEKVRNIKKMNLVALLRTYRFQKYTENADVIDPSVLKHALDDYISRAQEIFEKRKNKASIVADLEKHINECPWLANTLPAVKEKIPGAVALKLLYLLCQKYLDQTFPPDGNPGASPEEFSRFKEEIIKLFLRTKEYGEAKRKAFEFLQDAGAATDNFLAQLFEGGVIDITHLYRLINIWRIGNIDFEKAVSPVFPLLEAGQALRLALDINLPWAFHLVITHKLPSTEEKVQIHSALKKLKCPNEQLINWLCRIFANLSDFNHLLKNCQAIGDAWAFRALAMNKNLSALERFQILENYDDDTTWKNAMRFCNTPDECELLAERLIDNGRGAKLRNLFREPSLDWEKIVEGLLTAKISKADSPSDIFQIIKGIRETCKLFVFGTRRIKEMLKEMGFYPRVLEIIDADDKCFTKLALWSFLDGYELGKAETIATEMRRFLFELNQETHAPLDADDWREAKAVLKRLSALQNEDFFFDLYHRSRNNSVLQAIGKKAK